VITTFAEEAWTTVAPLCGATSETIQSFASVSTDGTYNRRVANVVETTISPDPALNRLYEALLQHLGKLGAVEVEAKKTSVHLKSRAAFAGIHPRKGALLLQIVADSPIHSGRVVKVDRVSANRVHNHVRIEHLNELDDELFSWLRSAYLLTA
jgi:hypothetical protein